MHPDVPYPKNGWHGLICTFANLFVQSMDVNRLHETLAGLDLIVVVDHQRTETVRWADVVLPATTWYEKTDLTATPLHPYLQLQQPAIDPVGESRSELAIWRDIVKRIAPDLAEKYFAMSEEDAIRAILAASGGPGGPTEGITLEQLRAGPVRLRVPDPDVAFVHQIQDKVPFPPQSLPAALTATAAFIPTRRIEFYKEDDGFLRLGETVPALPVELGRIPGVGADLPPLPSGSAAGDPPASTTPDQEAALGAGGLLAAGGTVPAAGALPGGSALPAAGAPPLGETPSEQVRMFALPGGGPWPDGVYRFDVSTHEGLPTALFACIRP
jgi:anaerobic selenocysteine-containing dehydrogenase